MSQFALRAFIGLVRQSGIRLRRFGRVGRWQTVTAEVDLSSTPAYSNVQSCKCGYLGTFPPGQDSDRLARRAKTRQKGGSSGLSWAIAEAGNGLSSVPTPELLSCTH